MADSFIGGQLVDGDGRPYFTEDAVADAVYLRGGAFRSDGYRFVTLDDITDGVFLAGILHANDGAMGVTTDAPGSGSVFVGGYLCNAAGRVHISDGGTPVSWNGGIGFTSSGAVATAGTVGEDTLLWDDGDANDILWDDGSENAILQ